MKKLMQIFAKVTVLCMLLCCKANAEWSEPFGDAFAAQFHLTKLSELAVVSVASDKSLLYGMVKNGAVYSFNTETGKYQHICQVPVSSLKENPNKSDIKAMNSAVSTILTDDCEPANLYGFNKSTGAIGIIDKDGVHFQSTIMDVSSFFARGRNYDELPFHQMHITDDKLECWVFPDIDCSPKAIFLSFSMENGNCTSFDIDNAFEVCRFGKDNILAAVLNEDMSTSLNIYSKSGNYVGTYGAIFPFFSVSEAQSTTFDLQGVSGPLCYEESGKSLYYANETHLYRSIDEAPFEVLSDNVPFQSNMEYSDMQIVGENGVLVKARFLWK